MWYQRIYLYHVWDVIKKKREKVLMKYVAFIDGVSKLTNFINVRVWMWDYSLWLGFSKTLIKLKLTSSLPLSNFLLFVVQNQPLH
jgi:hypothetical protein